MSVTRPEPLIAVPTRSHCPVCGKASYSLGGTHPQCAVARADAVLRADRKAKIAVAGPQPPRRQWSKACPRCGRQIPSRRVVCDCGHNFTQQAKS